MGTCRKQKRVTMVDIAKICGVSQPTVSDVINGKAAEKGICDETRDRILAVSRRLRFRRNGIARRLTTGHTRLLGIVLPYIPGAFMAEIVFALDMEAHRRGYHLVLSHSYNRREKEEQELAVLLDLCVDGLVVVPAFDAPPGNVYNEIRDHNVPLVFMDGYIQDYPAHFVGTDDVFGGRIATRHLIELGHRRIAHLAGPARASSTRKRRKGYQSALAEAGLEADDALVFETAVRDREGACRAMRRWLDEDAGMTAVFAASDMLAAGAVDALREAGKSAPEDIAIVGYGDLRTVRGMGLRLTTVRQPSQKIGRAAAQKVIATIEGGAERFEQTLIKPRLIVRESSGGRATPDSEDVPFWVAEVTERVGIGQQPEMQTAAIQP